MTDSRLISNPKIKEYLGHGDLAAALQTPLAAAAAAKDRLRRLAGSRLASPTAQENALYGALTLGDFLYDYLRIDPTAVEAIDFARGGDLGGVLGFAHFATQQQELTGAALKGSVDQLHGYVAERLAAQHLVAQGHDVTFPPTSNQEGWDMLVDGTKFQVKCLHDAGGVHEHLQHYDYPVLTNAELAQEVGQLPGVYIDPQLSYTEVHRLTTHTLHQGTELADFEVPWISLGVSSAAAVRDFLSGQTDLFGAVTDVGACTAGRIVFAKVGGLTGQSIGLVLLGPAGFLVGGLAGTLAGGMQGGRLGRKAKAWLLSRDQERRCREALQELAAQAAAFLPQKLTVWQEKEALLAGRLGRLPELKDYVQRRFGADRRYFENKWRELQELAHSGLQRLSREEYLPRLLTLIKRAGIHPHQVQPQLAAVAAALRQDLQQSEQRLRQHLDRRCEELRQDAAALKDGQARQDAALADLRTRQEQLYAAWQRQQEEAGSLWLEEAVRHLLAQGQSTACRQEEWQRRLEASLQQHLDAQASRLASSLAASCQAWGAASQSQLEHMQALLLQQQKAQLTASLEEYVQQDVLSYDRLRQQCEQWLAPLRAELSRQEEQRQHFARLKEELAQSHAYLEPRSLEFLTTAEFFIHQGEAAETASGSPFNFAPVVVEYCKVVEHELQTLLCLGKCRLYDLLLHIKNGQLPPLYRFLAQFQELRRRRNRCAHDQTTSRQEAHAIRALLGLEGGSAPGLLPMLAESKQQP